MIDDPLGLAAALAALLALALFGATLAPGRWAVRERWRTRTLAAAIIAGAAIALAWNARTLRRGVDLAPPVAARDVVPGEWRDGGDTVTFVGDATYRCRGERCIGMGPAGQWRVVGPHGVVVRWRDGHQVTWRVVGYRGGLRLALLPLDGEVGPAEGRLYYAKVP